MALCHALSLTCFHPLSFTLSLRWLHVFAMVTYISKLPWPHAFAALPQREILWVMPFFGRPEPCREWGYFYGTAYRAGDYVIPSSLFAGFLRHENYFFFTGRCQPCLWTCGTRLKTSSLSATLRVTVVPAAMVAPLPTLTGATS